MQGCRVAGWQSGSDAGMRVRVRDAPLDDPVALSYTIVISSMSPKGSKTGRSCSAVRVIGTCGVGSCSAALQAC